MVGGRARPMHAPAEAAADRKPDNHNRILWYVCLRERRECVEAREAGLGEAWAVQLDLGEHGQSPSVAAECGKVRITYLSAYLGVKYGEHVAVEGLACGRRHSMRSTGVERLKLNAALELARACPCWWPNAATTDHPFRTRPQDTRRHHKTPWRCLCACCPAASVRVCSSCNCWSRSSATPG